MTSEIIQEIEAEFQPLVNLVEGEAKDARDALYAAMKQVPPLLMQVLVDALPVVFAAAVPGSTVVTIGTAVAEAAIADLKARGMPILEADLAAFHGAALATAYAASQAPGVASTVVATTPEAPVV